VFWTNLRPDSAARRRVDPETLTALNDRLVYASLTGFGLPANGEGEFADMPAFDILIQGLTGLLGRNADDDGKPVYNGLPLADQGTSLFGAFGVLLGLRQRERTGRGCVVDVSMFDSMVAFNEKAISMFGIGGTVPAPRSSATTAPFGLYPTKDGWVCVAVGSDGVWRRFCTAVGELVGRPELAADETFWAGTERVRRQVEVTAIVESFTTSRSTGQVVDFLLAHDVPAGHPLEVDALLRSDQVRNRGVVRQLNVADSNDVPVVMSPVVISGAAQDVGAPPRIGADRERVLADWLRCQHTR
jgi:crotonobetainyl-CoA:carnitine CoA-transferase CaiB-like acyl-CoA transferase